MFDPSQSSSAPVIRRLAVGIVLLNLLVVGLAALAAHQARDRDEERAEVTSRNLAQVLEQNLAATFGRVDLALNTIADNFVQAGGTANDSGESLIGFFRRLSDVDSMGLTDENGDIMVWTGPMRGGRPNIGDRDYFHLLRDTPGAGLIISKPVLGRITGNWQIVLSRRVNRADGSFAGIAYAVIWLDRLAEMFSHLDVGPNGAVALRDGDLGLIARHPMPSEGRAIGHSAVSPELRAMVKAQIGAGTFTSVAGFDSNVKTVSFRKVGSHPLYIIVALATEDYIAQWRQRVFKLAGLVGVFATTTLALFLMTRRSWLRTEASIRDMQAARSEVEELSKLNSAVVSASTSAVAAYDTEGDCILANEAAARMIGGTVGGMLGQNFRRLDSWKRSGMLAAAETALASGKPQALATQCTSTFGRTFWVEVEYSSFPMNDKPHLLMVGRDVSDQVEARERLKKLVADLDMSNRELEQFAYVASHDLREPLRMISSYISLLDRRYGASFDAEAAEFIAFARDGALRMDRMVLDLLDFSRVGRIGDPFAPVQLAEIVETAIGNLALMVKETSAIITVAELPVVTGSRSELVRLVQNLISNALKYRHPDRTPKVAISAEAGDGEWIVAVADNGIGIASEFFERIFAIFQRLHTHDKYEGTGIGLAICRKIVQHHNGRIWVSSLPDKGSTFFFTLPRSAE